MSEHILHLKAGTRLHNTSVIAGDRAALEGLRCAIDDALRSGSGGIGLCASDGEPHEVAVVLERDMDPVYTSYAFEASPARSRRETVPIDQLENHAKALEKAATSPLWEAGAAGMNSELADSTLHSSASCE